MADAKDEHGGDREALFGNVDGEAVVVADKSSKYDALHFEELPLGITAIFVDGREGFPATEDGDEIYGKAP